MRPALDDTALLVLRLGFLGALYLFLILVAALGWREVRTPRRAPRRTAILTMLDPARSRWVAGTRITAASGASVGREPGNALVMDEDTVSARHAEVRFGKGRWWLDDLGSTNGTFVNQQPVPPSRSRALRPGDIVQFGNVVLRFEGEGPR